LFGRNDGLALMGVVGYDATLKRYQQSRYGDTLDIHDDKKKA